jgi:hypothetical protein
VSHLTEARTPHELVRTTGAGHNWRSPDPCVCRCFGFARRACVVQRDGDGNVVDESPVLMGGWAGLEALRCTLAKALDRERHAIR